MANLLSPRQTWLSLISRNKLLLLLFLSAAFLNLYGANWDQGHYLHPDERLYVNASNISLPKSIAEFFSPKSPLNPHMFYYGPLPLYLYKIKSLFLNPNGSFLITSRLISALFATLTSLLIFYIGKVVFDKKIGLLSAFIFIFSPGIIQHAHFITTESILNFLLCLNIVLCIALIKSKKYNFFLLIGLVIGSATASKITGITFILIPFIAYTFLLLSAKKRLLLSLYFFSSLLITVFIALILAPYQIIDFKNFLHEQQYMQGVILGSNRAPFTIIYENTPAYLYPLFRILPLTFGFLSLPLGLIGFLLLTKKAASSFLRNHKNSYHFIIASIIVYPLLYFLWSGAWYAKFSRYYILFMPSLSLAAGYFISKLRNTLILFIIIFISINGLIFFVNIYFRQNPRIEASTWVYKSIAPGSAIAGEHWDDYLPMPLSNQKLTPQDYKNLELQVYNPDSKEKIHTLTGQLYQSDYFIISSRRVYYSILRNTDEYPYTSRFYKLLFAGKLGFTLEKKFTNYPFFLSDDWADESFQSYDHPPVLVFKNTLKLMPEKIVTLIIGN